MKTPELIEGTYAKIIAGLFVVGITIFSFTLSANAQYFTEKPTIQQVKIVSASGLDSILFAAETPFALPATSDSIELNYHEPMPDSIMPRSAIVVGQVTVQAEEAQEVIENLEKFARKSGADWIVSFSEPRAMRDAKGNRVFRSSATLLRVLDGAYINMNDIAYSYYDSNHLNSYAAVSNWFNTYGRYMGLKVDSPSDDQNSR